MDKGREGNFAPHFFMNREQVHREKRIKKYERIQGLRALLEMWENHPEADLHHEYILELRRRLRSAEHQFDAMKI
jgi:hypothetical protein